MTTEVVAASSRVVVLAGDEFADRLFGNAEEVGSSSLIAFANIERVEKQLLAKLGEIGLDLKPVRESWQRRQS